MDSSSSGGDDRWKLSKKGRSRSGRPHAMDASVGGSVLSRSYSASVSSSRSTSNAAAATGTGSSSSSSGSYSAASSSQRAAESSSRLSKKCVEAVKEHRARFYIVRRCVSMLVCWRDY